MDVITLLETEIFAEQYNYERDCSSFSTPIAEKVKIYQHFFQVFSTIFKYFSTVFKFNFQHFFAVFNIFRKKNLMSPPPPKKNLRVKHY